MSTPCLACHLFYTNRFVRNDITELRNHHSCYRWQEQIPLIIHSDFSVSVTYICAKLVIKLQTPKPQFKSTLLTCAKFIVTLWRGGESRSTLPLLLSFERIGALPSTLGVGATVRIGHRRHCLFPAGRPRPGQCPPIPLSSSTCSHRQGRNRDRARSLAY